MIYYENSKIPWSFHYMNQENLQESIAKMTK